MCGNDSRGVDIRMGCKGKLEETPIPNLGKGNGAGNCNLFHDSTMSFYFHRYYYVLLSVSNVSPLGV